MIERRFNLHISGHDPEQWLRTWRAGCHYTERKPSEDTPRNVERLHRLRAEPRWSELRTFLRWYVEELIFEPFLTEREYWSLTVHDEPWVRINVFRQEVLKVEISDRGLFGWIVVRKSSLERALSENRCVPSFSVLSASTLKFDDQIDVKFEDISVEQLSELSKSRAIAEAAKEFTLRLMRSGRTNYGKHHCYGLVSALFEESPADRTQRSPGPNFELTDFDTESQKTVWVRQNVRRFVEPVKAYWKHRCAVTRIELPELLEACHIKPWNVADDRERIDEFNGVCLAVHVHRAFDAHLIGFEPDGRIVYSNRLSEIERQRLGLGSIQKADFREEHRKYLEFRYMQFLDSNKQRPKP